MTTNQLIWYLIGGVGFLGIGMQIEAYRWKKRVRRDIDQAYQRGWNSGRNFMSTIRDRKLDVDSAVRILTGEEGYDDESFSGS